jgi:hypothetical protein
MKAAHQKDFSSSPDLLDYQRCKAVTENGHPAEMNEMRSA